MRHLQCADGQAPVFPFINRIFTNAHVPLLESLEDTGDDAEGTGDDVEGTGYAAEDFDDDA